MSAVRAKRMVWLEMPTAVGQKAQLALDGALRLQAEAEEQTERIDEWCDERDRQRAASASR